MKLGTPVVSFFGGLGDVILKIYRTNAYTRLETDSGRVFVVIASHNPYVSELFKWHPKADNLVVVDQSSRFLSHRGKGLSQSEAIREVIAYAGLEAESSLKKDHTNERKFYAPDLIGDNGHIVFQPFAGTPDRNIPANVCRKLLKLIDQTSFRVYIVLRSYLRQNLRSKKVCHRHEAFDFDLPPNAVVLDHSSVPATLKLVQDASLFIGGDSALTHIAWSEGKPTVYLKRKVHPGSKGFLWGTSRDDCDYFAFDNIDFDLIETKIAAIGAGLVKASNS